MKDGPSVSCGVDGRKRNTAVEDLQERLVLEHKLSNKTRWNGLGEGNHSIMCNDCAAFEADGGGEDDARSCEELEGQTSEAEHIDS